MSIIVAWSVSTVVDSARRCPLGLSPQFLRPNLPMIITKRIFMSSVHIHGSTSIIMPQRNCHGLSAF